MKIDSADLRRFRLEGVLGEGAELQAFAATDTQTGQQVVAKRPHPALVARGQHRAIEQRLAQVIALREQLGDALPHVARLIAHAALAPRDAYFGDSLPAGYTVVIEERARGLPLVGSALDGVKRRPIGLPQNLFGLHPLVAHAERGPFTIPRDILDVAEAFYDAGHLLLDMRPQNVFFDPRDASVTVIDVGAITMEQAATRRRAAIDLNDFILEMFKWYTTPSGPPGDAASYREPYGMGSVTMFTQDVDRLLQGFSEVSGETLKTITTAILLEVQARSYQSFRSFRMDFEGYLLLAEERYLRLSENDRLTAAWREARRALEDPYWRKFLFDPQTDLAAYDGR